MKNNKYDYLFKILIIGESNVGKTCLLSRFIDNTFTLNHITTFGIEFKTKYINLNNKIIKYQIWDTSGLERFRKVTESYYKNVNGIIIVYDVSDQNSFKSINKWIIKQINNNAKNNIVKVLVGNKNDKTDRVISKEEGENLAKKLGMKFFETSAQNNNNINELFDFFNQVFFPKKRIEEDEFIVIGNSNEIIIKNEEEMCLKKIIEELKKITTKLSNELKKVEEENKKLNSELIEGKNEISRLNNELIKEKKNNEELNKKIIEIDEEKEKLLKELKEKDIIIEDLKSRYPFPILQGEKLMTVNFVSYDDKIHYSIICKNSDPFIRLEKLLCEKYPCFSNSEYNFFVNDNKVTKDKSLDFNNINDNEIILIKKELD